MKIFTKNITYISRSNRVMHTTHRRIFYLAGSLFLLGIFLISTTISAAPIIEGTFGSKGEAGSWFDPNYDQQSPLAQTATPGINFAGAGGVNNSLSQVHEFDAAVSTSSTGGAGYFLTESGFSSNVEVTVTPTYTNTSPVQTGLTYVLQNYIIANQTSSIVNNIWLMSYINADLFRANSIVPAQRVGLLNDEKVTLSLLTGGTTQNIILRQYQDDNTEIFFQGAMYKNGSLSGADKYMVKGPGTPSGGGDAVYDDIYLNGTSNFDDAQSFYANGTPIEYNTQSEYAVSIGFDIGSLSPGQVAEITIAIATETGIFAENYFSNKYPEIMIPEPTSLILLCMGFIGLLKRKILNC